MKVKGLQAEALAAGGGVGGHRVIVRGAQLALAPRLVGQVDAHHLLRSQHRDGDVVNDDGVMLMW